MAATTETVSTVGCQEVKTVVKESKLYLADLP